MAELHTVACAPEQHVVDPHPALQRRASPRSPGAPGRRSGWAGAGPAQSAQRSTQAGGSWAPPCIAGCGTWRGAASTRKRRESRCRHRPCGHSRAGRQPRRCVWGAAGGGGGPWASAATAAAQDSVANSHAAVTKYLTTFLRQRQVCVCLGNCSQHRFSVFPLAAS